MTTPTAPTWQISIDSTAPPEWEKFLQRCPDGHFFAHPVWTRAVCCHLPGARPIWLTVRDGERLVAGMVAVRRVHRLFGRLVSHFDGTPGGPLVAPDLTDPERDDLFQALVQAYAHLRRQRNLAATLTLNSYHERRYGHLLSRSVWHRQGIPTAFMPLAGGLAHVEMHVLKKNRRNERNRSLKRGCSYQVTVDPEILEAYYPIYYAATERWGIEPIPSLLLRQLLTAGEGRAYLTCVWYEGELIGGHLNLHWCDRVTVWNGATQPAHDDKYPATLLIWADLEEACRRGASWLDLGGSAGRAKLANFKRLLGAQEEIRGHYVLESSWLRMWRRGQSWLQRFGRPAATATS